MCGIAGIAGSIAEKKAVSQMLGETKHRGPDDSGIFESEGICIGMNRLAILDLSDAGHQPMYFDNGRYTIVYNGEIYNYLKLRKQLENEGETFISNSDTEVLLRLYVRHGEACLLKIRGMFAFAIWDSKTQELFAARDHMGIKPFVYTIHNNSIIFCSELKGLLASGYVSKEIATDALFQYLQRGYITAPLTIMKGVYALLPGYSLKYSKGDIHTSCYWDLKEEEIKNTSATTTLPEIRNMVIDAVKEELISDVPLGVFLSGGMDSAIVVAAMRASGIKNIKTFSIGFANDNSGLDESSDAKKTADFYQTDHHQLNITGKEIADRFDAFISSIDQPSLDGLNTFLVSEVAKKHVTVALSGLGGDELFIGYNWQVKPYQTSWWKKATWRTIHSFNFLFPASYKTSAALHAGFNHPENYYTLINTYYSNISVSSLLRERADGKTISRDLFSHYPQPSADTLRNISYYDMKLFMASRLLRDNDVVAMAHSLEVRFPLIDYRLCQYAWNLPSSLKLSGFHPEDEGYGNKKKLLFEAFKEDLPPDLGERAKRGFKMPYDQWLRNELKDLVAEAENSTVLKTYLHAEVLRGIFDGWKKNTVQWVQIWQLVVLDRWLKQYLAC